MTGRQEGGAVEYKIVRGLQVNALFLRSAANRRCFAVPWVKWEVGRAGRRGRRQEGAQEHRNRNRLVDDCVPMSRVRGRRQKPSAAALATPCPCLARGLVEPRDAPSGSSGPLSAHALTG